VNCTELERWLDDGGAPERHVEAMAHARICARCSATLGGVDELETLLATPVTTAPAGFAGRVMAKVAVTPQAPGRIPVMELLPFFQTVPWWVRVAVEPASLLAMLLASALVWRGDALFKLASTGAVHLTAWLAGALQTPLPGPAFEPLAIGAYWVQPLVLTCTVIGAAPLALMASRLLYRWSSSLVGPQRHRGGPR
jgi:multisubunit Na+/H+ antiporter MnhC subunit